MPETPATPPERSTALPADMQDVAATSRLSAAKAQYGTVVIDAAHPFAIEAQASRFESEYLLLLHY